MVILDSISEGGLEYIAMGLNDIICRNGRADGGSGLYVGVVWLTPETCYWFYKLLCQYRGSCLVDDKVLDMLKAGCNRPVSL